MPKNKIAAVALTIAALVSFNTYAAPATTFSDSALFNAAVINAGTDTYLGLTTGAGFSGPVTRSAGSYGYSVTTTDNNLFQGLDSDGFLTNNDRTYPIVFSGFTGGATAIGGNFFGSSLSGAYAQGLNLTLTVTELDGDAFTTTLNNTTRNSFFGYVGDSAITAFSVTGLTTGLWPSVDNFTLAQGRPSTNVSEPESVLLLGLGLLGLAFSRRRKQ